VGYGEWCQLGSLQGSVVSSPSCGVRADPAENGFGRILKATERSFLYLYDKNLRGTICIIVPYSKFWEDLSPAPPVIYAHVYKAVMTHHINGRIINETNLKQTAVVTSFLV